MISRVHRALLLFVDCIMRSTCAISSAFVTQPIFVAFSSPSYIHRPSYRRWYTFWGGRGERKRKEKEKPTTMKDISLFHTVLISSIRLLTVMNPPSLNTLARNPLIQCLWHSVLTPVFLDNPVLDRSLLQSLDKPFHSSTFWLHGWTPQPLFQLHSHDFRLPQIECLSISYIIFF